MWNSHRGTWSHDSHSSIVQCRSSTVRMTDLSDGRVLLCQVVVYDVKTLSTRKYTAWNFSESGFDAYGYQLLSLLSADKWSTSELKREAQWNKLSYFFPAPFKFPRMIASTVISLVVYITAVLGSHNIGKARRGLLQLNLKILWIFIFVIIGAASQWPNQVVNQHNQYRAQYGAPPVTWSKPRYSSALAHAKKCNFEHRYE